MMVGKGEPPMLKDNYSRKKDKNYIDNILHILEANKKATIKNVQ